MPAKSSREAHPATMESTIEAAPMEAAIESTTMEASTEPGMEMTESAEAMRMESAKVMEMPKVRKDHRAIEPAVPVIRISVPVR